MSTENKDTGRTPDQPAPVDPYSTSDQPVPLAGASTATYYPEEEPGTLIGPYKLLQKLGKGGMGVVWMAEQREPVQRFVAVKIIKSSLQGNQVAARFEAERQALAMMDHPNIAKVLDAGTAPSGRPYFVMELVKGISFTQYCDQEKLTLQQRLELFIPVCNAVQHAHQKGVVHRDLKPSNILIANYDGKPVPKVIDFGVAKATHHKLTEKTMFTEVGQIVGTLEYMAPEQAELNNLDIDTRADIYSLGVVLYEILTGSPPFSAKEMRAAAFDEMLRMIREVEPFKPSTKISSSEHLPSIAANRMLEPKSLTRSVRGDLDWIVMKCLEKERSRRYDTANQLSEELRRFLCDEPVQAGPPSVRYRAQKFFKRNKGTVIAASLVLLSLLAGIIGTTIGMIEANLARGIADEALRAEKLATKKALDAAQAEEQARKLAERRLAQNEKANRILESIFKDVNFVGGPFVSKRPSTKDVAERWEHRLSQTAKELNADSVGDPLAVARLQHFLGAALFALGKTETAIDMFTKARDTRERVNGLEHEDTIDSMQLLAFAKISDGLGKGPDGKRELMNGKNMLDGTMNRQKVRFGEFERRTLWSRFHMDFVRPLADSVSAPQPPGGPLGGDLLAAWERTYDVFAKNLGKDDSDTERVRIILIETLLDGGDERAVQSALKLLKEQIGTVGRRPPDFPMDPEHRGSLFGWFRLRGHVASMIPYQELIVRNMKQTLGADDIRTLDEMRILSSLCFECGEVANGLRICESEIETRIARYPKQDATLQRMEDVADHYLQHGQIEKSLRLSELWYGWRNEQGSVTRQTPRTLGLRYLASKKPEKGVPFYRQSVDIARLMYADELDHAGSDALRYGQAETAEPFLRECLAIREKTAPDNWTTFNTKAQLGGSLSAQKKYEDAEPLLKTGYAGMKGRTKAMPYFALPRLTKTAERLVHLYQVTGNTSEEERWRKEVAACKEMEAKK